MAAFSWTGRAAGVICLSSCCPGRATHIVPPSHSTDGLDAFNLVLSPREPAACEQTVNKSVPASFEILSFHYLTTSEQLVGKQGAKLGETGREQNS